MKNQRYIIGLIVLALTSSVHADVIYVDSAANGENDGSSWSNGFNNLQDGLDAAQPGFEVWVAQGGYVPERDRDGLPTTGPQATFVIKSTSVKILGGFRGFEGSASERDPLRYPAIIEGEGQKWHLVYADEKFYVDTSTRFDGFVIRGGFADGDRREDRVGGGMLVVNVGLTIANCTFVDNHALLGGAGLHHDGENMNVVNCRFLRNTAISPDAIGGGLSAIGPIHVANCVFAGNTLGDSGYGSGAALLCNGGGFCAEPTAFVSSCTFTANAINGPYGLGGALYATPHVRVVNSIVWGNVAPSHRSIGFSFFGPGVTHSDVQDGFSGIGNFNADPQFVNGPAGNARLSRTSPCTDTAFAPGLPSDFADLDGDGDTEEVLPLDLDLTPREIGQLNLGCFETFDCDGNNVGDYNDIAKCAGDPACGDCNGNSVPDGCDSSLFRLYVNPAALGTQTGESWENAYQDLMPALCAAHVPGSQVREIWVRRGIYTPDSDSEGPDREATFQLRNNLAIYGGFGGTETDLSQRDIVANSVVLTGDMFFNDEPGGVNIEENSIHVVTAMNVDATAVLDGIAITGGNAEGLRVGIPLGGGMLVIDGSPTIRNSVFLANYADIAGGGIAVLGASSVRMSHCFFARNGAPLGSAIAALAGGQVTVSNSRFRENGVLTPGAAVGVASNSRVEIESCTLTQNFGPAGLVSAGGILTARNSIFWDDVAPELASVDGGFLTVRFCDVQGGFAGEANIDADPLFISPDGPDGEAGTLDDDLRLSVGSPCIDAGDPLAVPSDALDADGAPRVQQCRTDIGTYESELFADCDGNGSGDACEIAAAAALDCNGDFTLDRCGTAFADCDGDGISDACQADSDEDGVIDACDGCPADSSKTASGLCGCGRSDADTDGDGFVDCLDNCPAKPNADQRDGDSDGAGDACDSLLRLVGCPGDLQVTSSGLSGTDVSFALPQAVDGYGEVRLASTPSPGSFFAVGETRVTITATDDGGGSATCSFLVTVIAPVDSEQNSPESEEEEECPPLYRANGGAVRFLGFPFGCGPGCLVAMPLTLLGIAAMKRGRNAFRR